MTALSPGRNRTAQPASARWLERTGRSQVSRKPATARPAASAEKPPATRATGSRSNPSLLLVAGLDRGDEVTEGFDLLPVALVAGGFSALAAGLAVAGFLLTWLRPVRSSQRALAG